MRRNFVLVPVEERMELRSACTGPDHEEQGSGTQTGVCAGGNRVSGGAPGNGPGLGAGILDQVTGPEEMRGAFKEYLSEDQISWLSDEQLLVVLQCFSFRFQDIYCYLDSFGIKADDDVQRLRGFFTGHYLRCMELVEELDACLSRL